MLKPNWLLPSMSCLISVFFPTPEGPTITRALGRGAAAASPAADADERRCSSAAPLPSCTATGCACACVVPGAGPAVRVAAGVEAGLSAAVSAALTGPDTSLPMAAPPRDAQHPAQLLAVQKLGIPSTLQNKRFKIEATCQDLKSFCTVLQSQNSACAIRPPESCSTVLQGARCNASHVRHHLGDCATCHNRTVMISRHEASQSSHQVRDTTRCMLQKHTAVLQPTTISAPAAAHRRCLTCATGCEPDLSRWPSPHPLLTPQPPPHPRTHSPQTQHAQPASLPPSAHLPAAHPSPRSPCPQAWQPQASPEHPPSPLPPSHPPLLPALP